MKLDKQRNIEKAKKKIIDVTKEDCVKMGESPDFYIKEMEEHWFITPTLKDKYERKVCTAKVNKEFGIAGLITFAAFGGTLAACGVAANNAKLVITALSVGAIGAAISTASLISSAILNKTYGKKLKALNEALDELHDAKYPNESTTRSNRIKQTWYF